MTAVEPKTILWMIGCFLICVVLTPLVKTVALQCGLYAKENERTIHHGKIPRIGGVAIYIAFMIGILATQPITTKVSGVLIGMTLMFLVGLVDDKFDLSAKTKLCFQIVSALILIAYDVRIDVLRLPFGITLDFGIISVLFTIVWVVGITNAINLIDGLDGLASGMSSIVLGIISLTALIEGQMSIVNMTLLMVATLLGFLIYNAHPASIFMGDCGSLPLGFFISAVSLLGFKSATVMTLALPILILFIPILDTISAILRRTLHHRKFSSADKQHVHHQLMRKFGQTKSVLIMCGMTACFGLSAFIYMYNKEWGLIVMFGIILILELFVERTGMISEKFHPLLTCIAKLRGKA